MNSWGAGPRRNAFSFAADTAQRGGDLTVWAFLVFWLKAANQYIGPYNGRNGSCLFHRQPASLHQWNRQSQFSRGSVSSQPPASVSQG